MTQLILCKVYGYVSPASTALYAALSPVAAAALPVAQDPVFDVHGSMLRISFEGIYLPITDMVEILQKNIALLQQGRIDYLDMEAWTLTRYTIENASITSKTVPLDHVLAYSGQ